MQKLTLQHGVTLEPQMQDNITSIMEETFDEVRRVNLEQSFRRLFWEQQLQAINAKDLRQVRWHPAYTCIPLWNKLFADGWSPH